MSTLLILASVVVLAGVPVGLLLFFRFLLKRCH